MDEGGKAIIVAIIALVTLTVILIMLFVVFQKRKNILILKQKEAEKQFEQEITKAHIEIREETFRNISWELHDNIGQLLTLAKIQLQSQDHKEDVKTTLDKALKEVRVLSKAINPEALNKLSLTTAVQQEIERFNRLQYLLATLSINGKERPLNAEVQTVFFRILQEFFSNTIKHAKATALDVCISFKDDQLNIMATDNGVGFDNDHISNLGIGLTSIAKRAQLVGAEAIINSAINEGTQLLINYFYKKELREETQITN